MQEICRRLEIQKIHLRTREDPMLAEFLAELEVEEMGVAVPTEIRDLVEPFRIWQEGIVDMERRSGRYVMPGSINQAGLTNAMERAQAAIQRGDPSGYRIFFTDCHCHEAPSSNQSPTMPGVAAISVLPIQDGG